MADLAGMSTAELRARLAELEAERAAEAPPPAPPPLRDVLAEAHPAGGQAGLAAAVSN